MTDDATTHSIGSAERPLRVAVVGSGPAGFYAAEALVKHKALVADVDLFERLPAPHGLVRYGVAPDHQKIKSVTAGYDKLLGHDRVRFLGNVHVGHGVTIETLLEHYDQVLLAVGCETDRRLGIEGEDARGSHAATSFVAWYNGHPDFREYAVELDHERAVVVGVGDVAMDLARLLSSPQDLLATTDMAGYALDVFARSAVREVVLLGRRGPAHAAFATRELEDLAELPDVDILVDEAQVHADLESGASEDGLAHRKLEYLATLAGRPLRGASRRVVLRFLASPTEIQVKDGRVVGVRIERNVVTRDASGRAAARGTGEMEILPAGLVLRSVGYRGVPLPGVPFDEREGIVPNRDGRVLKDGEAWPGVYVAGWIKRGPSGVIGTNKGDAAATVLRMAEDVNQRRATAPSRGSIDEALRGAGIRVVTAADWKRLDQMERERGAARGKVRDKLTSVEEMLAALAPRAC